VLSSIIPQYYYGGEEEAHLSQRRCFPLWTRRRRTTTTRERSGGGCGREKMRAREETHTRTHTPVLGHYSQTIIFGGFPKTVRYKTRTKMQQRAIIVARRKSRRDANETSRPSPAIRAARSFLFPKS